MVECICNSCKNLKGLIDDEKGAVEKYECEFGFPSDVCADCEAGECELTCANYVCDDEQDESRVVKCKACGRELNQECGDSDDSEVYCIDCYLKNI